MSESVEVQIEDQEFQLEPDNELRFEVENKNETVVLEVSTSYSLACKICYFTHC